MSAPSTCVVHLVRAVNGPAPFERFLASYRRNPGGLPHRLLLLMKGFRGGADLAGYDLLLAGVPHDRLFVRDFGYDIRPYLLATRKTSFERYCFLNSYSVLLDREWLAKLSDALRDDVGAVSATGSWVSHVTNALADPEFRYGSHVLRRPAFLARWGREAKIAILRRWYEPYPNYHVRTNAFLARREHLLEHAGRRHVTKFDVYAFESARWGLSARLRALGLGLRVVGRDGRAYREPEWAESNTFWQRDQENLLVADNQTARYAAADLDTRAFLARWAWADRANPAPAAARATAP